MIFEDLEIIWRKESAQSTHTIDDEALRRIVLDRAHSYRSKILWRDISEIGMDTFVVLGLIGVGLWAHAPGRWGFSMDSAPLIVTAIGYAFVASFRFISRQRQKGREAGGDDSIQGNLQKLVANAEYQIRLKSSFFWWYMLPIVPGFALITIDSTATAPPVVRWLGAVVMLFIFGMIYWGNWYGLRHELVPQKKELEALLDGLENGGKTAEIRATGTDLNVPKVPLSRRLFALSVAVAIFGLVGWLFYANFWPPADLRAPKFDNVSAFADNDTAEIDAWLLETVEQSHYPSLSVAIVREGKVAYQRILGVEDTWSDKPASTSTAFHVASVSKAFTAALAVLLHDRGVIDLDEPVGKYLPQGVSISNQPELGGQITFRQLAAHTSGLPRSVPGTVQSVEGYYQLEPQRLYDHLAEVTLEYVPGTNDRYSNLGFGLLGHALELAAKKPLNELLQELLCDPLKLERTAYHVDKDLPVATGYTSPVQLPEGHSYRKRLAGSGGLVTSVGDLAKFLSAQMTPGLFSTNMLGQLHTAFRMQNGSPATRALGWRIDATNPAGHILSKSGGRKNCSAWIGFSPEHKIGVAVIANVGGPDVDSIGQWLLERSVPGGSTPTSQLGSAKAAPFSGVRWENDRPIVHVQDRWAPLVSIDGLPIERIMEFARQEHRDRAEMRFGEDLPELLAEMGHKPNWEVTLGLMTTAGAVEQIKVRMTRANRDLVRDKRLAEE